MRDPEFLHQHVEKFYQERVKKSWDGGHILRGLLPTQNDLDFTSNDYLHLAHDQRIMQAEITVLQKYGHGIPKSAIYLHDEDEPFSAFEAKFAKHIGTEASVLCQSGYDANLGVIEAFANPNHPIYIDARAHASLWKGCKSAGISPIVFQHNNYAHLHRQIKTNGPGMVVVDAVYSIDGSICPLIKIAAVVNEHNCSLVVDETHSLGVQGAYGQGLTSSLGLTNEVSFQVVGLSKAFASRGGLVCGSQRNMDFFRWHSYPAIFSTRVMTHEVAGYSAALDVIRSEDWRRTKITALFNKLRNGLLDIGFNVVESKAQILSIESGEERNTIIFRDYLERRGIFGSVFCWPATPENRALIRFTVNASHSAEIIEKALFVFKQAYGDLAVASWKATRRMKAHSNEIEDSNRVERVV